MALSPTVGFKTKECERRGGLLRRYKGRVSHFKGEMFVVTKGET